MSQARLLLGEGAALRTDALQAHDHLFRYVFSQPEHAAGELKSVLQPAVVAQIDWSTLALLAGSFVDPVLKELRTDLLFSATLGGRRVLLYLLLEHQSTADPLMPLRLLAYMVRIWEHERRERPEAKLLPAILPVVVSHDDAGWHAPTSFAELLDLPPDLTGLIRPHMVDFEMVLDDLTDARDDELRGRAMMQSFASKSELAVAVGGPDSGSFLMAYPTLNGILLARADCVTRSR